MFKDDSFLRIFFSIIGSVPIIITCSISVGFALYKPEKLQSEDYQLRHESLQIIQQKGGKIVVDPASIEAIANPVTSKQLETGED